MGLTAEYVLAELEKHADVLRDFGVKRIGLFGSVARGEATPDSDLDLVVDMAKWSFSKFMELAFFLEDHFKCNVDLVPINSIRPELEKHVLDEAVYAQGV